MTPHPRFQSRSAVHRRPSGAGRGARPRLWLAALLAALLVACSGEIAAPGEPLRLLGDALPPAFLGEPYSQPVQAVGGLRPFTYQLADGALPPGLALDAGSIRGTPVELGDYRFTVQVSDANLNSAVQVFTLRVEEVPPPELLLEVPSTEVDAPVTVRARLDGRLVQALRTQLRWDAERFRLLPGSLRALDGSVALLSQADDGQLQVDLAVLGEPLNGERTLFSFVLEPLEPGFLQVESETEFAAGGAHAYTLRSDGGVAPPVERDPDATPEDPGEDPGTDPGEDPTEDPSGDPTGDPGGNDDGGSNLRAGDASAPNRANHEGDR